MTMRVYVYDPNKKVSRKVWADAVQGHREPHCVDCRTGLGELSSLRRKRCTQCQKKFYAQRRRERFAR